MTPCTGDIGAALKFSETDLAANRRGLLSTAQGSRLKTQHHRSTLIVATVFVLFVFLSTILIYVGQNDQNMILSAIGVALILINAITVGLLGRQIMQLSGDLRDGGVEVLAGTVERVLRRGRQNDKYILRISGNEFNVTKDMFVCFRHMAGYRIYRTRLTQVLLSAESDDEGFAASPLDGWSPTE